MICFLQILLIVVVVNLLAGWATDLTIGVMRQMTPFASAVRELEHAVIPYYNTAAYPTVGLAALLYLRPLIAYFSRGGDVAVTPVVQRRTLSAPLVITLLAFAPWVFSLVLMPALTVYHFGRWSPELMSQQILSPLVNGFLAATADYFMLDWYFRARVMPRVFREGRPDAVPGAWVLGVRARLSLFLVAVAFTPLFTLLGIARGAATRLRGGVDVVEIVQILEHASTVTFGVYVVFGIVLTMLIARSLTRPLADVANALRRVQAGDLDVALGGSSVGEVGVLETGVNQMVAALRDKERILTTFGRVVEPYVRDRLLAGEIQPGGEVRTVAVMFCDLRGFTALAERELPQNVVATLNEFFSAMTERVRANGGFVDKFIGDAMLVVFGLFDAERGEAGRGGAMAALHCAAAMRGKLQELNLKREAGGMPPLRISGSIHAGEVVAGIIGAQDRHEYTVIGDTVNVASRLQVVCKERGLDFLVSEAAWELARAGGYPGSTTFEDTVPLRGRREPVRAFRLE
jgi:adenylate cyclase